MSAILLLFLFSSLTAQDPVKDDFLRQIPPDVVDTITNKMLPVKHDTVIPGGIKISKDAIDTDITYTATDIKADIVSGKIVLIDKGKVNYGDIELTADSIELDMETSSVYATGRPDSTGKMAGKPVFKDGSQEFESRELTYNFKTEKAIVKHIRTEQEGGYLNSNTAKLNNDGTIFVDDSKYSTCDKEEPDFYIHLKKAKFYPGEKIVSGPANLVVADIPLPLIIPYGFFPIQTKRASGLIMPSFGQANSRGYYLENGGFYFAINDYSDLKFTGAIYTNGSWRGTIATTYKVRYKYAGNLSFSYSKNISGYSGLETYSKATNYQINWSHSQDSKASPSSRFSASVNMSSSGYDKSNSYNIEALKTSTRNSSINYSKSWVGTPFNFSTSFNHNQNVSTDVVSVNLPKATLTVSRFYPLKPKNPKKSRWYHDVQLQYTANIDNRINTYDSVLFTNKVWDDMTNGFSHSIPVSIPIKPFANFSISPSLSYSGVAYTQKKEKHWDPDYINPTTNKNVPSVVDSVSRGLYYGHAIVPSISFGYSPSVYGTFQFTNPAAKIQAIRHVIKPSVSFSFTPSFPGLSSDMYRTVQSDTLGHYRTYSIYEGSIYGTPSAPGRSGSVAFNLVNILEAKVFASNDTTGKPKKVKLIDNLSAGTRYDVFADSCNWSDIGARFSTTIAQNISVSVNSTFNLYAINDAGGKISKFAFSQGQGFARMTSFSLSVDFDLASLINGKKESGTNKNKGSANKSPNDINSEENPAEASRYDEFGYVDFDMPWSMNVSYSYMYSKSGWTSSNSNGFTVNGDVKVTPKISLAYSSGYDFVQKELSYTSISIVRDLHCWQMSVSWSPVGPVKFWSFRINPKSGILKDLKYERKKDRYDTY